MRCIENGRSDQDSDGAGAQSQRIDNAVIVDHSHKIDA